MDSKNYKLFKRRQYEIFNMFYKLIDDAPFNPDIFGTATEEEKEKYNKVLNEYLDKQKPEFRKKLKEMGFELNES